MMRWRTTAVLAILLVGLATFYYVYEIRQAPEREKAAAEKDRLWPGIEPKDIEAVTITRGEASVRLEKSQDAWALTAPVAAKADLQRVEELLRALATVRREREIDASPAQAADFGLAPPAAEIVVRVKEGERRLRLGARNPTGLWVYAQTGDGPAVFLIADPPLREAEKKAGDFRDRTVLAFAVKEVEQVEVHPGTGPAATVERLGRDDWALTAPARVPADAERVRRLLQALHEARVKEFVEGAPPSAAQTGLDRPLRVVLWVGEGKDRAARALRLGAAVPDKKAVYAAREGDAEVFLLEGSVREAVPTTLTDLRDKAVVRYDRARVTTLGLESPKGTIVLAREGAAWRISQPADLATDQIAVDRVLQQLEELRAKDFLAEAGAPLGRFGLDRPRVRVTVTETLPAAPAPPTAPAGAGGGAGQAVAPSAPGTVPATPEGAAPSTRETTLVLSPAKEQDLAYATTLSAGASSGPVVVVEAAALDTLSRSVTDLRDRSLFPRFEPRDVARVEIGQDDQTLALERRGDDDWRLVAPRSARARASLVGDVILALRGLRWREIVAEQGWDAARYGLDRPGTTVRLRDKGGQVLAALAIGKRESGQAYARVLDRPALYVIDSAPLARIPASADDLL